MRRLALVSALRTAACVATILTAAAAQPAGDWSTWFDPPGLTGRVFALGTWQGQLVAGGQQFRSDGQDLDHVALFDGTRWQPLGGGITNDVRDFTVFEGDLIAAGWFHVVDGTVPEGGRIANGVARWDGESWQPLGDGLDLSWSFDPEVWAVEVYNGELYAGGQFDNSGGKPLSAIARWDGAEWQPVGGGLDGSYYPTVHDLTVTSDNRLVAVGSFDTAEGQVVNRIAAWDGARWSGFGGGLQGNLSHVFAVEEFDGKLYATGNFPAADGQSVDKLAAWNGSSWEPVGSGLDDFAISVTGYALEVFDDALYIGGNFTSVDGSAASRIVRWTGSAFEGLGGVSGGDLTTTVFAMQELDGKLYVGGEFTRAGAPLTAGPDAVVSNDLAAFDGEGWERVGHGLGFDREVWDLTLWNGRVVAVGRFVEAGGAQATRVAMFDGVDWVPLGATDGNVRAALVFEGDLIITGEFSSVDGVSTGALARFDGTQWSAMGQGAGGQCLAVHEGELFAGGIGSVRRWNGSEWVDFSGPLGGFIYDLQSWDGALWVGGSMPAFNGQGPHLIAFGPGGAFTPAQTPDDTVTALDVHDGELLVGGEFTQVGGQPARILARFDGTSWQQMGNLTGFKVSDFAQLQGELYVSGDLHFGTSNPADYVARWNGSAFEPLGGGLGGYPFALVADDAAGTLWVGGWFYDADDHPSWNIAQWLAGDVSQDDRWLPDAGGAAGSAGRPILAGRGTLQEGAPTELRLHAARPLAPGVLVLGFERLAAPFKGGVLGPTPDLLLQGFQTDAAGRLVLQAAWGSGLPSGLGIHAQLWVADPAAPAGWAGSETLTAVTP